MDGQGSFNELSVLYQSIITSKHYQYISINGLVINFVSKLTSLGTGQLGVATTLTEFISRQWSNIGDNRELIILNIEYFLIENGIYSHEEIFPPPK